tara:strand:- start:834 stop:2507 length:1674 start_codon:yes stop_codon:yes gene_type:complete
MKILLVILSFLALQTSTYSNTSADNKFNQKYLSNYFSALVSSGNQKNEEALKYFNSSKFLIQKHDNFLKKYVFSLVLNGQVKKGIDQIKISKNDINSNDFELNLLLLIDSFKKKDFKQANKRIKEFKMDKDDGTYEFVIFKILKDFNYLFLKKEIIDDNKYGVLSLISTSFQNCYLNTSDTSSYFRRLVNSSDGDYSRYMYFYFANLIKNKNIENVIKASETIEPLGDSILIHQIKNWIDNRDFKKFKSYFSCDNENDILAEIFYLISNLFSTQNIYDQSNFYLRISEYLNPKFYFNRTLLAENYYLNNNNYQANKILKDFKKKDKLYFWYKTKKIGRIISEDSTEDDANVYINKHFNSIKNPTIKILYDYANINKGFGKYEIAIQYYTDLMDRVDENSYALSRILYRRGSSYERLGDYEKADKDLIESLRIYPNEPYALNYLAYSWLERNYKIDEAINMIQKAYKQKENDPYITDSVGWGYYLIGDYINAEKYLKRALQLMPDDPIVNDHYGDVLWQLDRKLQAKYYWQAVLELDDTENEMRSKIKSKLLEGLEKS